MAQTYLLLGSNLGNKIQNLRESSIQINDHIGHIIKESKIYKSAAWGYNSTSEFFNQVVLIETNLGPTIILEKIHQIEFALGRIRSTEGYTDRSIDIDILFYDSSIIKTADLEIPHQSLHKRKFTLVPLAEIASDYIHPVLQKTISELLAECYDTAIIKKL